MALVSVEWLTSESEGCLHLQGSPAGTAVAELGALAQQAKQAVARLPRALPPAWLQVARACQRALDALARSHAGPAPRAGAREATEDALSRAYSQQTLPCCARCGKRGLAIKRCARCMRVCYCR